MVRKPARETRNFAGGQRGFGRAPHILREDSCPAVGYNKGTDDDEGTWI